MKIYVVTHQQSTKRKTETQYKHKTIYLIIKAINQLFAFLQHSKERLWPLSKKGFWPFQYFPLYYGNLPPHPSSSFFSASDL